MSLAGLSAMVESGTLRKLPPMPLGAELWLADLSCETVPTALSSLSDAEQARAARFVFQPDRRRYVAAHLALRALLAHHVGRHDADLEMKLGPHDKPFLAGTTNLVFNMSHSGELALIAIARDLPAGSEIGVDIEALRPMADSVALARANYTSVEQAELIACPPALRDRLFLSGWTRKEACLKAVGSGLSIAPSTFECGLAPQRAMTRIGKHQLDVESIDVAEDYIAALAMTKPCSQ
jgi:4'-phosphopantetheinyl transferase